MQDDHLEYAQGVLNSFIFSAIQRMAHSGDFVYRFSVGETDIRSALGLTRAIKSNVLSEYVNFFQSKGIQAVEQYGSIDIVLNLNSVSLNPAQSDALNTAMTEYREIHG